MKLLCCSDLHLDDCTYGKVDKSGNTFRTHDHQNAFEWVVTQALDVIHPDMFVITGDIYESPLPPNNVREFFNHQLVRLSNAGIQVRIIVGNHDCGKFHSALQPLRAIPIKGLSVCVDPIVEVGSDNMAGNTMLYLPYSIRVERKDISQREHFMEMASSWMEDATVKGYKSGDKTFFFGHFGVSGALMNDGYRDPGGNSMTLGDMDIMGADYSLLGDYHGYQPFRTSKGVVIIPGSLERTDFGDLNASKGFVVYDSENIELPDTGKFRHVSYPKGRKFVKIDGDEIKIPELIEAHRVSGDCKDAVVRVKFNGTVTGYRVYEFTKKNIKDSLEAQGVIHVVFEDRQHDPELETKAAEIKEQIRKSPKMSEEDIEEIIRTAVKLEISDEVEAEKAVVTALEIVGQVKQEHGRNESSKTAMAVRIHGLKMHNFLRYGETDNIVELDPGAKEILSMPVKRATWMKDIISNKCPDLFVKWNNDTERRVISIVGMTDGDSKFSNGSGKSSCLESISYGFFERLVREFVDSKERKGVSTNSIVTEINGEKKAESFVEILFSAGGSMWLLRRGRKSNKDGSNHSPITSIECLFNTSSEEEGGHSSRLKAVNNEAIAALIGMDYDTFSNSVMFGQNDSGKFIKGTDKMRKDILMNVLHLWMLEYCLEKVRDMKKDLAATLESLNSQVGILVSPSDNIEALNGQIADIETKISECAIRLNQKSSEMETLRESLSKINQDTLSKDVKSIEDELSRLSSDTSSKKSEFNRRMTTASKTIADLQVEIVGIEKDKENTVSTIASKQKAIDAFDEASVLEEMEVVRLAKEARPKRVEQSAALINSIAIYAGEIGGIENELAGKRAEIKKLNSLKGQCGNGNKIKCSSCNSMVGEEHLDSEIAKYSAEIEALEPKLATQKNRDNDLKKELADVKVKISNCDTYIAKEISLTTSLNSFRDNKDKLVELNTTIGRCNGRILSLNIRLQEASDEFASAKSEAALVDEAALSDKIAIGKRLEEAKAKLAGIEGEAKTIKDAIDAMDRSIKGEYSTREGLLSSKSRIETKVEDIRQRGEKVSGISLTISEKQLEYVRIRVLERVFGLNGIPSKIIERYMPLMNSYVAEYLDVISNHKIKARMSMEESGEIRLGISGDGASQSDLLSGGELVKIKLAFSIALGMLSFVRSAHTPEFICLDEIFAPVDIGTKDYVFQTIEKLKEHFRDIIVISHDTALLTRIKSSIVVNKVDGVSRIERQHYEKIPEDV